MVTNPGRKPAKKEPPGSESLAQSINPTKVIPSPSASCRSSICSSIRARRCWSSPSPPAGRCSRRCSRKTDRRSAVRGTSIRSRARRRAPARCRAKSSWVAGRWRFAGHGPPRWHRRRAADLSGVRRPRSAESPCGRTDAGGDRHPSVRPCLEPVPAPVVSRGTSKRAVRRRFVAKTRAQLDAWPSQPLDGLDLVGLVLEGVHVGEHGLIVALGIAADGQKHALGLWEGATEKATLCQSLLAKLQSRGLRTDRSLLVIREGSKALRKAVRDPLRRRRARPTLPGAQAAQRPRSRAGAPADLGEGDPAPRLSPCRRGHGPSPSHRPRTATRDRSSQCGRERP